MADRDGSFKYLSGTTTVTVTFGEDYTYDYDQQSNLKLTSLFRSNSAVWSDGRTPYVITVKCWALHSATSTTLSDIETLYRTMTQNALDKSCTLIIEDENSAPVINQAGWYLQAISKPKVTAGINGKDWVSEVNYKFIYP